MEDLYYFTVCCFFILKSYFINSENTFDNIGKDTSCAKADTTFAFSVEIGYLVGRWTLLRPDNLIKANFPEDW